tara:strand:+ start:96 stop:413 length:318 start_codon:yes stop_codon:yes gene_type:complete
MACVAATVITKYVGIVPTLTQMMGNLTLSTIPVLEIYYNICQHGYSLLSALPTVSLHIVLGFSGTVFSTTLVAIFTVWPVSLSCLLRGANRALLRTLLSHIEALL